MGSSKGGRYKLGGVMEHRVKGGKLFSNLSLSKTIDLIFGCNNINIACIVIAWILAQTVIAVTQT